MGKRKHKDKTPKDDNVDSVLTEKGHDLPSPKYKRTVEVSETAAANTVKSKQKKSKNNFVTSESEQNSLMFYELNSTNSLVSQNKKSKTNKSSQNSNESTDEFLNKVVTVEKKVTDVVEHHTIAPQKKSKKKNKQNTNVDDEEAVHDDDIDNFCNDLSEQDNAQYDQWIQLLEAKLNSNKKS